MLVGGGWVVSFSLALCLCVCQGRVVDASIWCLQCFRCRVDYISTFYSWQWCGACFNVAVSLVFWFDVQLYTCYMVLRSSWCCCD